MKKLKRLFVFLLIAICLFGCQKETQKYYTINFTTNSNVEMQSKNVKIGDRYILDTPIYEGYHFVGWFLDENFNEEVDFLHYDKECVVNVYAKWISDTDYINQVTSNNVIDEISRLPKEPTLENEKAYLDVLALYEALSDEAKAMVSNYSLLTEGLETIESIKLALHEDELVNNVISKIESLPEVITIEDEDLINETIALYDALEQLQPRVTNYSTLEKAINDLQILKQNIEDEKTIQSVIEKISAINDDVTLEDEEVINVAKAAYDALSSDLKARVTNAQKLTSAYNKLKSLIDSRNKVNKVIDMITLLSEEINLNDNALPIAKQNYDNLTTEEKERVVNKDKLLNLYSLYLELLNNENAASKEVIDSINLLPSVILYDYKEEVVALSNKYNSLSTYGKSKINNYSILNDAINKIELIEQDVNTITYCLGKETYTSRAKLYEALFSDFYYFILRNGGQNALQQNSIFNVNQFLAIGSDYNYGRGTMRGLGDMFGSYLLSKDLNGVIGDQGVNKFFGYCFQNGKYVDLIDFFIRFFAYWRIDEGYAKLTNYGADMFAEAWAPTVDICKFFYFTPETTYVKSARMLDLFNNCSNVCYGTLNTNKNEVSVLPVVTKRGYVFEGWYDNPEFSGSSITTLSNTSEKVVLYAKWSVDQNQQDTDAAALVDVYIHNLTTTVCAFNKENVQKVRTMYNNLTQSAKQKVTLINTLLEFENQFTNELTTPKTIEFVVLVDESKTFEQMKSDFLTDFNSVTSSSISDFNDFINNRYAVMKKLKDFYNNSTMYFKWSFIVNEIASKTNATGLSIQSQRIISNGSGDLEYVSKALGYFFLKQNASSDSEVGIDFSLESNINEIVSSQHNYKAIYSREKILDSLYIEGFEFLGYFSDQQATNQITMINDSTPETIYIIFN